MNVWSELDRRHAEHVAEEERTRAALRERRGGALRVRHGLWWCSWRPTRGDRRVQRVSARSPADLLARLDLLIASWPRKRPARARAA